MSMDMIERVARALLASESNGERTWESLDSFTRTAFKRDARAAIEAMREETRHMRDRAKADTGLDSNTMSIVWQSAINAALAEAETK